MLEGYSGEYEKRKLKPGSLKEVSSKPRTLELAGLFDDVEADKFKTAIGESRKIDKDEW